MAGHTNEITRVPNQGWDERIIVCRNEGMVDTFIIVTERYVVLVDTVINPATAAGMMAVAAAYLSGRQLLVINTHADYDHAWGNQLFVGPTARFPAPIVASRLCAELLTDGESAALLRERQQHEPSIFGDVVLTPPTILFDETLRIDGGDLTLDLFLAPGHRPDHVAIFIPEIRTLLAGDAAEVPYPITNTVEDLPVMRQTLQKLAAFAPVSALYCHAPVTIGPQLLLDNIAYFDRIEAHCRAALAAGLPADPPADADLASLIDLPFAKAVPDNEHWQTVGPYGRTEGHAEQIRMMLTWLAKQGS